MSWFRKKKQLTDQQTTENALMNAKNRQIRGLENTLIAVEELIAKQNEIIRKVSAGTREDKLIALGEKYLPTLLENRNNQTEIIATGTKSYTDDEIRIVLSRVPQRALKQLVTKGEKPFKQEARKHITGIDDESLNNAWAISQEVLFNEK